jgi:hypothetical protein
MAGVTVSPSRSTLASLGRGYAPKGQTPVVPKTALFIMFLRRLIASGSDKLFLIVDRLRVHHSVKVSRWVEAHRDES